MVEVRYFVGSVEVKTHALLLLAVVSDFWAASDVLSWSCSGLNREFAYLVAAAW